MKFLVNIIFCGIILLIPMLLLKPYLENTYDSYKQQRLRIKSKLNGQVDAVILGSSHAESLNSALLEKASGKKFAKFNRGGEDLFESIYTIKSINRVIQNQVIIVSISPFSYHYDNHYYNGNKRFKGKFYRREKRIRLYSTMDNYKDSINLDFSNYLFSIFYPIVTTDHLAGIVSFEKVQNYFSIEPQINGRRKRKKRTECKPEDWGESLTRIGRGRARSVFGMVIPNMQKNAMYEIHVRSFEKLYRLCESLNGYNRIVLYTPPYWPEYNKWIPEDIKSFVKKSNEKLASLPNVDYLDFREYQIFSKNPCWFNNADHLNKHGSVYFTQLFYKELKKLEIGL